MQIFRKLPQKREILIVQGDFCKIIEVVWRKLDFNCVNWKCQVSYIGNIACGGRGQVRMKELVLDS